MNFESYSGYVRYQELLKKREAERERQVRLTFWIGVACACAGAAATGFVGILVLHSLRAL